MTDHDESKLDRTRPIERTALLDHTPEARTSADSPLVVVRC